MEIWKKIWVGVFFLNTVYLTFHLSSRKFALYNAYIISLLSLAAKTDKMYSVVISILCDIFADHIEIWHEAKLSLG